MGMFNARPGETRTGLVRRGVGGPETPDFKDALLYDFDIDGDTPKPAHIAYLAEVKEYLGRVKNIGSGRAFVIWIKGYASRTGSQAHNYQLSAIREQGIEGRLRDLLEFNDYQNLAGIFTFRRDYIGFRDSPAGENPAFRAVRLTVSRVGPPPPPIKIVPEGSKSWNISLVALASVSISPAAVASAVKKALKIAGKELHLGPVSPQIDEALFQIKDLSSGPGIGGRIGLFAYTGFGLGISVPKLGPISGGVLGRPFPFTTTQPVLLRDFAGDASFGQPPGIGPYSVAPSSLAIQSHAFMMAECKTDPDSLKIFDVDVLVTVGSVSKGWLVLLQVDGKTVV
jgi:hypothetical protein